jgi:hypothetical protein
MNLILLTGAVLAAFVAVWVFFVVPAERRYHERKLEMLRRRIEQREAARLTPDNSTDNDEVAG